MQALQARQAENCTKSARGAHFMQLATFAGALTITVACSAAFCWYSWRSLIGVPDEQVLAAYQALLAGTIGTISSIVTELLRPQSSPRQGTR